MGKVYQISMEVAGSAAMFTRPDTGGTPTSYPVPTWSASKGLFESIAFFSDGSAWICPTKVEVCRRIGEPGGQIHFQRYTTNYGGPLRKADLFNKGSVSGGSSMQLFATILSDVCYRLYGVVVGPRWNGIINPRHYLKDLFDRRLIHGECFRTPCFGWSEFACSYWGPPRCQQIGEESGSTKENKAWESYCKKWGKLYRDETEVDDSVTLEIPSMLLSMWDKPHSGYYSPKFTQGMRDNDGTLTKPLLIQNGVLKYDVPDAWLLKQDKEVTGNA